MRDNHAIQGGGCGDGFRTPRQLLDENEGTIQNITSAMFSAVECANPASFNNELNNDQEIWKRELFSRLCHQHCLHASSVGTKKTTCVNPGLPLVSRPLCLSAKRFEAPENAPGRHSRLMKIIDESPAGETPSTKIVLNATRVIPKLPKTIEELTSMWRLGCSSGLFKPLWTFEKVEERKRGIPGYTDSWWKSSGQKCAFLRFKRIVSKVVDCMPDTTAVDLYSQESDQIWIHALQAFHMKWDVRGVPLSLSAIERASN